LIKESNYADECNYMSLYVIYGLYGMH